MLNKTFFETLRIIGGESDELNYSPSESIVDSILKNLNNILNTRRGNVQISDSYGMPDLTNFPGSNISDSTVELERLICTTVERYEPRLTNVKVNYNRGSDKNGSLKFSLSAETVGTNDENQKSVIFETIIISDGVIRFEK